MSVASCDAVSVRPSSGSGRFSEGVMRNTISKAIVGGLAALSLAASLVATTEPASAQQWHGGGGWHGGGWHGGYAWRGGGGRYWHPGYWRGGVWYNGWWGPAIVAGALAAGALATYPYYGYGYGYGYGYPYGGCWQVRPVYDAFGNYLGQQSVNVCQ
jgi:hypothetical protein